MTNMPSTENDTKIYFFEILLAINIGHSQNWKHCEDSKIQVHYYQYTELWFTMSVHTEAATRSVL